MKDRYKSIVFFMHFALANCDRIAIENPIGIMGPAYRKADQIIQPWQFAINEWENTEKATCLWLKGLPALVPVNPRKPEIKYRELKNGKRQTEWYYSTRLLGPRGRAKAASKTFPGIAKAMAEQWSEYIMTGGDHGNDQGMERGSDCGASTV